MTVAPAPPIAPPSIPAFRPLTAEDVRMVHEASLRVLEETGVEVSEPEARGIFAAGGAKQDGDRIRIPSRMVERALETVPHRLVLYGRRPGTELYLDGTRVYMGTGGMAVNVLDVETGKARRADLIDSVQIARLVDALPNIDFYMRPLEAHDIPSEISDINRAYAGLAGTAKHFMGGAWSVDAVRDVIRLAALLAGDEAALVERPIMSFVVSWMVSPLRYNPEAVPLLTEILRRGMPVALSTAPMTGTNSPATLAGTLTLLNAEELSGLVYSQLVNPGTPILYGAVPSAADLRTGAFVSGAPEFGLLNAAAAQLAQFYELPLYNSGGTSDSKVPDFQAGYEKALTLVLSALAGANYIHHAAGILDSLMTVALEQYVLDDEVIGAVRRIMRGIEVNADSLAVDVINQVGPGAHYLAEDHTLRHMRSEFFFPSLADRGTRNRWEGGGSLDARERARRRAKEILGRPQPELIAPDLDARIRAEFDIRVQKG
ncbi:MAG: trimethylamine methyltransferase family protein [Gemmatimonadales bacterium]